MQSGPMGKTNQASLTTAGNEEQEEQGTTNEEDVTDNEVSENEKMTL